MAFEDFYPTFSPTLNSQAHCRDQEGPASDRWETHTMTTNAKASFSCKLAETKPKPQMKGSLVARSRPPIMQQRILITKVELINSLIQKGGYRYIRSMFVTMFTLEISGAAIVSGREACVKAVFPDSINTEYVEYDLMYAYRHHNLGLSFKNDRLPRRTFFNTNHMISQILAHKQSRDDERGHRTAKHVRILLHLRCKHRMTPMRPVKIEVGT